jgi:uncharacterized protein (TIGR02594 family)
MSLPPWLLGALEDIGVHELPGSDHDSRVIEYHSNTGRWSRDEVPWCGSAVETWLVESGFEGLGRKGALARSWARWGRPAVGDELGAICVLKRRKRGSDVRTGSRGGYHVGIFLNYSRGGVAMVSGNASDRVGIDVYSRRRYEVKALRMPRIHT